MFKTCCLLERFFFCRYANAVNYCTLKINNHILFPLIYCKIHFETVTVIFVSGCMAWFEVTDEQKKRYNRSNNSKNIQSIVMVLVHDTSSYCALQLYEVSFK